MGGFSMSTTEQTWVSTGGDTNNPARIKVSLVDYGNTEAGYAMLLGLGAGWSMTSEDAHHRSAAEKVESIPYTQGYSEYNKDSKDAKYSVSTGYRYVIVSEASNQPEDKSDLVKTLSTDLAKKLEGK
jgi:hypothetical protein